MISRELDGLPVLQSDRLLELGVSHGWFGSSLGSTRIYETMTPEQKTDVEMRRQRACKVLGIESSRLVKLADLKQSDNTVLLREDLAGKTLPATDGCVTTIAKLPILLDTADCMQTILYDPTAKTLGVVHAGGRGTASGIIANTVDLMREQGAQPERIVVAIGPAIAPQHFVPSREVDKFNLDDIAHIEPVTMELADGRKGYDIVATAVKILGDLGVRQENIETSGIDTFSSADFYSWERNRIAQPELSRYRHGLFAEIQAQ